MKLFLVNCFCLLFFFAFHAQEGLKLIVKAETQIEKKNYKKALRLLEKAESRKLGYCGLAVSEAYSMIAFNRSRIRAESGKYLEAANELNNKQYDLSSLDIDSLKIVYFIKALGKDRIKKEIDSCLQAMTSIDEADLLSYEISLKVGFSDKPFTISYERNQIICMKTLMPNKESTLIDRFRKAVMDQTFYKLLL
jgi:hypothetical protein